jgi:alpha-D-ribose 1-methylphosphonate 5-triphosphate synthase subunit PhnH
VTATSPPSTAIVFDPVFDAQTAFRTLLDSMARPGTVAPLGVADPRCPLAACRALAALARTLLDHEVAFAVVAAGEGQDEQVGELSRYLTLATGSRPTAATNADFVFVLGPLPTGLLPGLRRGIPTFPDDSATVVILAPNLDEGDGGLPVALQGPGVPPNMVATLAGLIATDLVDRDTANSEPPCGLDLILIDPAGRILCLPRSTKIRLV